MKFGVAFFPTKDTVPARQLIPELESRGFESLFVAEHSHIPKTTDRPLPRMYYEALDPFVYLATAATVDSTLLLGTAICLVPQRDPIQTAKQVASVDVISGGRFVFGVGAGWNLDEMRNHGVADPSRRFASMRERVEAMQAIWTTDVPEYHGEFVEFGPMECDPKPLQRPHPPILVGGTFPGAPRRAVRYGNGWLPRSDVPDLPQRIPEFRRMGEEAGRRDLDVTVLLLDPAEADSYADAGADRLLLGLPPAGLDATLRALDGYADVITRLG